MENVSSQKGLRQLASRLVLSGTAHRLALDKARGAIASVSFPTPSLIQPGYQGRKVRRHFIGRFQYGAKLNADLLYYLSAYHRTFSVLFSLVFIGGMLGHGPAPKPGSATLNAGGQWTVPSTESEMATILGSCCRIASILANANQPPIPHSVRCHMVWRFFRAGRQRQEQPGPSHSRRLHQRKRTSAIGC